MHKLFKKGELISLIRTEKKLLRRYIRKLGRNDYRIQIIRNNLRNWQSDLNQGRYLNI